MRGRPLLRLLSLCALLTSFAAPASAQSLTQRVREDYAARATRPRASSFPKRILVGRPPSPDVYESPAGNKISDQISIMKPPPGTADGMWKVAYYSAPEQTYWVHVTGGIAGFNYWEGGFSLGSTSSLAWKSVERGSYSLYPNRALETLEIRDAAKWASFWKQHSNRVPTPAAPAIDFSKERVLAVILGQKPSGGYGVSVEGVAPGPGGTITVSIKTTKPSPGAFTTTVITNPFHLIRINDIRSRLIFKTTGSGGGYGYTAINFLRTNASARRYELLTVDAKGSLLYESRDPSGQRVVASAKGKIARAELGALGRQAKLADFWNLPSSLTTPRPAPGSNNFTTKLTDAPSGREYKVHSDSQTTLPRAFAHFTKELNSILDRLARSAQPSGVWDQIAWSRSTLVSRGIVSRREVTVRKDGLTTVRLIDPRARTAPVVGLITTAELATLNKLYAATDFMNQSFPLVGMSMGTNSTTLSVKSGAQTKAYSRPSSSSPAGPKATQIKALESYLAGLKPSLPAGKFDELRMNRSNPSGFPASMDLSIRWNGDALLTRSHPTARYAPAKGTLSPQQLATVKRLFAATDFFGQNIAPMAVSMGTPLTALFAKEGRRSNRYSHVTGSPGGPKAREIKALEDFLATIIPGQAPATFDQLTYSLTDVRSKESETLYIRGSEVQYVYAQSGQSIDKRKLTLSAAERKQLDELYTKADVLNLPATFPMLTRRMITHRFALEVNAAAASNKIAAPIHAQAPATFDAFRAHLDGLLARFAKQREQTIEGRLQVIETYPESLVVKGTAGSVTLTGALSAKLKPFGGYDVKVRGLITKSAGRANMKVSEILSPSKQSLSGKIARSGGTISLLIPTRAGGAKYKITGRLKRLLRRYQGQKTSVTGLVLKKGTAHELRATSVSALLNSTSILYPIGRRPKGTKLEIRYSVGGWSIAALKTSSGTRMVAVRTRNLKLTTVRTPGIRGALGGAR